MANVADNNSLYIPRTKLRGHPVHTHQIPPVEVEDRPDRSPAEYMAQAFALMQRHLQDIAKKQVDETKVFDEYQGQNLAPGFATATLTLQPSYEYTERVESIIIVGPAGACTLQLGDRVWPITIPAAGIFVIAPVAVYLGRDDTRQLTASTAGDYSLELMGHADGRWST